MSHSPFTIDTSSPHILLFSKGDDAKCIKTALKELNFDSVQTVDQCSEAISKIKNKEYDILLLDLDATLPQHAESSPKAALLELEKTTFPDMIRETSRSFVSVLMMSSNTSHEIVSFAYKRGALDFLPKSIGSHHHADSSQQKPNGRSTSSEELKQTLRQSIANCMEQRKDLISDRNHSDSSMSIIDNLKMLFRKTRNPQVFSHGTESIVTPIELVVKMISELVEGNYSSHQQRIILGGILKSLVGSSNVYHPQVTGSTNPSPWFTSEYLNAIKSNNMHNKSFSLLMHGSADGENTDDSTTDDSIVEKYVFPPKEQEDTKLENLDSFDFDMFKYSVDRLSKGIVQMFESFDLINHFNIDVGKLMSFIWEARSKYLPNLYHNWEHAWDVLQFTYACLHDPSISKVLDSPLDKLCTLVAAIGHDIGHEGVNNSFQKRTQSPLAMLYNDEHVLEHYHASTLFNLILKSRNNIIEHLSEDDYFTFREIVINAILCTDPERHCEILAKFNSNINAGPLEPTKENKKQVIAMVVKSADISNVTRPFPLAQKWAERVIQEFLSQGDRELSLGLTVNSLNDRTKANKSALQMGFIKFFATPLFESMANAFPTFKPVRDRVEENHRKWSEVNKREEETGERPRYDLTDESSTTSPPRKDLLVFDDNVKSADILPHTEVVSGISILCVSTASETHDLCRELLLGYHQFFSENSVEEAKAIVDSKNVNMIILESEPGVLDARLLIEAAQEKHVPIFMLSDTNDEPQGVTQFAVKPVHVPDFFKHCNVCIQASLDYYLGSDLSSCCSEDASVLPTVLGAAKKSLQKISECESKQAWDALYKEAIQLKSIANDAKVRSLAFAAYDLGQTCVGATTPQGSKTLNTIPRNQVAAKILRLQKEVESIENWQVDRNRATSGRL